MLFSLSFTGDDAEDLSWLLHKKPFRFQSFDLSFGQAHVFFPEFSPQRATVGLLLEMSSQTTEKASFGPDFHFVNDEEYISSSFLSVAIGKVFGSALKGVCKDKPEALEKERQIEVRVSNFPCRYPPEMLVKIFEPLGLKSDFQCNPLAENFPDWGIAPHGLLTLSGRTFLKDILAQLYILIPFFDRRIHYWLTENELATFIRMAKPWLVTHPERRIIIGGYFRNMPQFRAKAMEEFGAEKREKRKSLNDERHEAIAAALLAGNVQSAIDLGCGEGKLLKLLQGKGIALAGMDISMRALTIAKRRLAATGTSESLKCELFQGSLTCRDKRIGGYDAVILCEVIEHIEPDLVAGVMHDILGVHQPRLLIMTTPNHAYNVVWDGMTEEDMRHSDHRFELNAAQFRAWADGLAAKYGYRVEYGEVGEPVEGLGAPTMLGVFRK